MKSKKVRLGMLALSLTTVSAGLWTNEQTDKASSHSILPDQADGRNWPTFGRTNREQHFSPVDEVNRDTIDRLALAWSYDLPPGNSVTGPIVVDGVLFTATGYSVVRIIVAATGKLLWEYDPGATEAAGQKLRQGWGSRGIAWWNGKIFTGAHDGRLIAIDSATGKEVWSQMTGGKDEVRLISGPPRVFNGKVIIGHGGADVGSIRGYVTAFEADTGRQLWRFLRGARPARRRHRRNHPDRLADMSRSMVEARRRRHR